MYLPKSKYSIKYTNGGLLATISDNVEYIGKYIETSGKVYIAGTKLNGPKLKLIGDTVTNMDRNQMALFYNSSVIGTDMYNTLKTKRNLPSSKPQPTEEDYKRGHFQRYYIYKNNEPDIIYETSTEYLDEYKDSLDYSLYTVGSIKWSLNGEKAIRNNKNRIDLLKEENIFISSLFPLWDEYIEIEEDSNLLNKLKDPNEMLDEIPTFTLEQWNMFSSLDKEKLIIKYGEVNISDL